MHWAFDNTYARELEGYYEPWQPAASPDPTLVALNDALARELALDPSWLRSDDGLAVLAGNTVPDGAEPIAQAYSGHQFGYLSPMLGDGRAVLLGELIDGNGNRRDISFKGSGRTPFSRGGDGKAVLGPVLREYVVGEAMHALGIPTTRALAAVTTGETVLREQGMLPGAILTRVASSHLRVGTFEMANHHGSPEHVRKLADYAIARHYPELDAGDYAGFLSAVVARQAELIAAWMSIGFIHGVMNSDNMTISGETIDYGPCAFMDAYDDQRVFSSIDTGGRYRYANQPPIAVWNLSRLAETLVPLMVDADGGPQPEQGTSGADEDGGRRPEQGTSGVDEDGGRRPERGTSEVETPEADDVRKQTIDDAIAEATRRVEAFAPQYRAAYLRRFRAKLGIQGEDAADQQLVDELLSIMQLNQADFTGTFRRLAKVLRGEADAVRENITDVTTYDGWQSRWLDRVGEQDHTETAQRMDAVNPIYIPRNHLVEEALQAAVDGELGPFEQLLDAVTDPFTERPGLERYAEPAPDGFTDRYVTFCGT